MRYVLHKCYVEIILVKRYEVATICIYPPRGIWAEFVYDLGAKVKILTL